MSVNKSGQNQAAPLAPSIEGDQRVWNLNGTPYLANTAAPLESFKLNSALFRSRGDLPELPGLSEIKAVLVNPRVGPMTASDDLTDAKIAASEARNETKVARLEGKIDTTTATIVGKLDSLRDDLHKTDTYNRDTRLLTLATIVAAAIALGGLIVAMATYGDALFGRGMNVRDVMQSTIKETMEQIKKEATKLQQ